MSRTPPKTPAELADLLERKAAAADREAESAVLVRMATCEGQANAWRWAAEQVRALPDASVAEGGPMSSERLAEARAVASEPAERMSLGVRSFITLIRDVLADRDHWHGVAKQLAEIVRSYQVAVGEVTEGEAE